MRRAGLRHLMFGAAGAALALTATAAPAAGGDWPGFRGPSASGVGDGRTVTEWDMATGENVRWKTPIAGLAHSCPVIWGDRLFVTSAEKDGEAELKVGLYGNVMPVEDDSPHRFVVHCLDKTTGAIRWSRTAWEGVPQIKRHPKGSHAASTPATDGRHVVAFFGSEGLYCYDMDGALLWKKDLGRLDSAWYVSPDAQWGFASSPVIHDGRVYVQCDVIGDSFLAAFDVTDGAEVWRTPRDDVPTWSTPTVAVSGDRAQIIVNGWKHIGGYDLRSGKELWKLVGGGDIPVPTPVLGDGVVFITNAHGRMAPIYAVKLSATGEVSMDSECQAMQWSYPRRGNYMQTPLVYGKHLYCCNDAGILTCYVAGTGEQLYRERLGGGGTGFTASIVAADGKLYVTSEVGEIHVVRAGEVFELLAVNDMTETCMATPAISGGVLYFRTRGHVVAVGKSGAAEPAEP